MHTLKYNKPARFWEEALPLGNGRIGAMIHGGVRKETVKLNEDTLWSGRPGSETGYKIKETIDSVRRLLRERKYSEADRLTDEMTGAHDSQTYQMAGRLLLDFGDAEDVADYENTLQLDRAVATTRFSRGGVRYMRESFVSKPHQVLAMRLSADEAGALTCSLSMDSLMNHSVRTDADHLVLQGQCPFSNYSRRNQEGKGLTWEQDGVGGMKYLVKTKVLATGGRCRASDDALEVCEADDVILLVAIQTGFRSWNQEPSADMAAMEADCDRVLDAAAAFAWQELKTAHEDDFRQLYTRMSLDLKAVSDKTTNELLQSERSPDEDTALTNLVFNYGRYLLISSSRPGTQPANLQGIWNDKLIAPWRSNYTTNINLEMNYWPAETCNLPDCAEPLLTMVCELSESGRRAARELYDARGWCLHHNCDLWRYPYTGGSKAQHAFWPVGAAWLCQHVWEHYRFSGNRDFLTAFLPVMKAAAAFFLDFMVETSDGKLTTSPSTSPENRFFDPETGEPASVCEGSAMDLTMIRELFENVLEGSAVLDERDAFTGEIETALGRLAMPEIGQDGRLLEFGLEAEEPQPEHRHISHLYGVYPGWMFTPNRLPEYYEACRQSLDARGDKSTGWAMAWRVAMWARFRDGDRALKVMDNLLRLLDADPDAPRMGGGGLYANLWDAHPPFQIDGNFGVTAGIVEMLLQSHQRSQDGRVILDLLPACPVAWPNGSVSGLRARGGLVVGFSWEKGTVCDLTIQTCQAQPIMLVCNGRQRPLPLQAGENRLPVPGDGRIGCDDQEGCNSFQPS